MFSCIGAGEEIGAVSAKERGRRGLKKKAVAKVKRQDGHLSLSQVLRVRVRYFTEGVAFGSQSWIEELFAKNREKLQVKREEGARKLKAPGETGFSR